MIFFEGLRSEFDDWIVFSLASSEHFSAMLIVCWWPHHVRSISLCDIHSFGWRSCVGGFEEPNMLCMSAFGKLCVMSPESISVFVCATHHTARVSASRVLYILREAFAKIEAFVLQMSEAFCMMLSEGGVRVLCAPWNSYWSLLGYV